MIVLMDANAQPQDVIGFALGGIGISETHRNHTSMLATLEECRLRLPATFREYALHNIEGTFFTQLGEIRIDIVASCNMCVVENAYSEVWMDFDMVNIKPDQLPSAIQVKVEAKTNCAIERRR